MSQMASTSFLLGFSDQFQRNRIENFALKSIQSIQKRKFDVARKAWGLALPLLPYGMNQYNYRDMKFMEVDNRAKFGVPDDSFFEMTSMEVFRALKNDFAISKMQEIAQLLKTIPVLVYNGQVDMVVNVGGVMRWLEHLKWDYQKEFNEKRFSKLRLQEDGPVIGNYKSYGNLAFAVVFEAGHLLPKDNLEASMLLLDKFIAGEF
eukprot:TRINITY_DN2193_c0_g1_i1.p1 TRINITY_DN2193_c0_g1~~TRINITY_DN2193_c0_g1_i1.p1  ORF type:complete len:205 (+),score=36.94 TRINITY_DN2193_c0_g1_i1:204-818(+)